MRICAKQSILFRIFLLTLATLFLLTTSAWGAEIIVREVDTSSYPKIALTLLLPSEASQELLQPENLVLKEDGKVVKSFELVPISHTRQPISAVLVLDSSGSMEGTPLNNAKSAARLFIEEMQENDRIAIISFATQPQLLSGFTSDKSSLYQALDTVGAKGDTALYDALYMALEIGREEKHAQRNIVILSDGKDTKSTHTLEECIELALDQKAAVFSFGLSSPNFQQEPLKAVAERTGGKFSLVSDSASLSSFYTNLARELHSQYRINYTSLSSKSQTKISIETVSFSYQLKGETTFSAPIEDKHLKTVKHPLAKAYRLPQPAEKFFHSWLAFPFLLAVIFLIALIVSVVVLGIFFPDENFLQEQLKIYETAAHSRHSKNQEPNGYLSHRPLINQAVTISGSLAERSGFMQDIQLKVERSGLPLKASEFVFLHICSVVLIGFIGFTLFSSWILRIGTILLATPAPLLLLEYLKNRREALFHQQLPDTLDLIAGALKAGYSFLQAVDMTVKETAPPISSEFKRVLAETRLGLSLEDALDHMASRVQSTNFNWTVMAVKIQREVGGNLAEVLEVLADTIRQRDRIYRQIKVLTAEGRLSAIILFLLPFALGTVLFIVNPQYIASLFTTAAGMILVAVAVLLMIVGGIWLKKIVTIEV